VTTNKKQAVSLDLTMLETALAALRDADAAIDAQRETAAQALKSGMTMALDTHFMGSSDTIGECIQTMRDVLGQAEQCVTEMASAFVKLNHDGSKSAALLSAREAMAKHAEAIRYLLVGANVEGAEAVAIPSAPKLTGSGATTKVKTSGIQYWRQLKGKDRQDLGGIQNKWSSLAFYAPVKQPTEVMNRLLKAAGWDGTTTTSQSFEITIEDGPCKGNVVTIGWDVAPTETTPEA